MQAVRPIVNVFSVDGTTVEKTCPLAAVFRAPIRPDVVRFVHTNMAKNKRQPYAVSPKAGMQHSAASWGTGRAVARVPRVAGSGTHRAGQGAFANMCRKGRMFAPTKTWRRWHRKISINQRRYAVVSAVAATAVTSLVLARGHRIEQVGEIPLVVSNKVQSIDKTKAAIELLKAIKAFTDVEKVKDSKKIRPGQGKMRNRRFRQRKGPLVIYDQDEGITKGFRNIPGIELASVNALNLLTLAPGGTLGRFCIWTEAAFAKLDSIFGTFKVASTLKTGYTLPAAQVSNADMLRVMRSEEVQAALRPAKAGKQVRFSQKKNPLVNRTKMQELNPHYATVVRREMSVGKKTVAAKPDAKKKRKACAKFVASLSE